MPIESIIEQYFISPIWERTGYNIVNTSVYAIIALCAIYFIYRYLEKKKIEIGGEFWAGALAWTLFGTTLRVITDSVDSGVFANAVLSGGNFISQIIYPKILEAGVLEYGYFTVTPGIYVVVASLFLLSFYIERRIGLKYWAAGAGLLLALINFIILSPMFAHIEYGLLAIGVALFATWGSNSIFKLGKIENVLPVFAHSLDGAATWIAIDFFGPAQGVKYFEQHVVSNWIGEATFLGFGLFFILKTLFAVGAVKAIGTEENKRLVAIALLAIAIMGLAPGIRNMLRMISGT